jgi:hypothetical protein
MRPGFCVTAAAPDALPFRFYSLTALSLIAPDLIPVAIAGRQRSMSAHNRAPAAASPFVMLGVTVPRRDSCRSRASILP